MLLRDPVAPIPPEAEQADRQRRQGQEQGSGDSDHHPRADLAEREAAGDPPAEAGEQTEDCKLYADTEQEEQSPDGAVPGRSVQL